MMTMEALLTLTLSPGLGPTLTNRAVELLGGAEAVLGATSRELGAVKGIGPSRAETIKRGIDETQRGDAVKRELDLVAQRGAVLLSFREKQKP